MTLIESAIRPSSIMYSRAEAASTIRYLFWNGVAGAVEADEHARIDGAAVGLHLRPRRIAQLGVERVHLETERT